MSNTISNNEGSMLPQYQQTLPSQGDGSNQQTPQKLPKGINPSQIVPGQKPEDMMVEYVCSKGDVEYYSVKDSFDGVRAHEERHQKEYQEIADGEGLKVRNPQIEIFKEYFEAANRDIASGGKAKCNFTAEVDGKEIDVPVSKDGKIEDANIAKMVKAEKERKDKVQL